MAARCRLGVVMGVVALLALTTLCPISPTDEARADARGVTIGITVATLSEAQRDRIGYTADGVLITSVASDGAAARAGIIKGDILVVVGSVTLRGGDDFDKALGKLKADEEVAVVIARNGGRFIKVLNVVPESLPEEVPEATTAPLDETANPPVPFEKQMEATPTPDSDVPAPSTVVVPGAGAAAEAAEPVDEAPVVAEKSAEKAEEKTTLASLGVECQDLDADLAAALGVNASAGALVLRVKPESPAAVAGIRSGDVVTALGSEEVAGVEQLSSAVERLGREPAWKVERKGETREVSLAPPPPPPAPEPEVVAAPEAATPSAVSEEERRAIIAELRTEVETLRTEVGRLRRQLQRMKEKETTDDGR